MTTPEPTDSEVAALRDQVADYDLVVVGTVMAHLRPREAALASGLIEANERTVCVAMRTPWDITAYPAAKTFACSYGALEPSTEAFAAALFGEIPFRGKLPVEIRGLYSRGHGLT